MKTRSTDQKNLIITKYYIDTLIELRCDLNKYNVSTSRANKINNNFDILIYDISKFLTLNNWTSVVQELKYQTNEELLTFGRSRRGITDEEKIIQHIKNRVNKGIDFLKNLYQKLLKGSGPRLSYDAFKYELNIDGISIKISGKIHKHFLNHVFKRYPEKDQVWFLDDISKTDDRTEDSSVQNKKNENLSKELWKEPELLKNYRSSIKYLIDKKLPQRGIKDLFIMNNDAFQINRKYLE